MKEKMEEHMYTDENPVLKSNNQGKICQDYLRADLREKYNKSGDL